MKVLNKVLMGAAALVLLTGCAKQVELADFQAKVDAMEEHTYSQATVKYDVNLRITSTGEQDIINNQKGEVKFTYNADKGEWETTDEEHEGYVVYLRSIRGKDASMPEVNAGITQEVSYYIDSMMQTYKVQVERKGGYDNDGIRFNYDKYIATYTYNKYGWLTKYTYEVACTSSGVIFDQAFNSSENGYQKISISYK